LKIRNYVPSDLDQCRALWAELVQRHRDIYGDPSIGGENPGLEFDQHLSLVGPERVWIATEAEAIAGLVSLIHRGQEAEVEPIIVSSQHRGRGIGRKLLDHAVEQARALGVQYVSIKPVARNESAISFFHDGGFRTLGHIELFMWLGASRPGQWRPGPDLFGKSFDY
jgi:ribosomal protein S18 acetylase RimI-like enzyme